MDDSENGQLQVIIGPMYSGKTSELIRRIQRFHLASFRCLIIKYAFENKLCSKTTVVSHDGHSLPAILAVNLKDLDNLVDDFDVIGIDEAHMFSDLLDFCQRKSDGGKRVIVAGLDSREKNTFHEILNIIPLAETVTKLTSICMSCADEAPFTKAIHQGEISHGREKFVSVCGYCYDQSEQNWMSPFKNYISST